MVRSSKPLMHFSMELLSTAGSLDTFATLTMTFMLKYFYGVCSDKRLKLKSRLCMRPLRNGFRGHVVFVLFGTLAITFEA